MRMLLVLVFLSAGAAVGWWTRSGRDGAVLGETSAATTAPARDDAGASRQVRRVGRGGPAPQRTSPSTRERPTLDLTRGVDGVDAVEEDSTRDEEWARPMEEAMAPILSARIAEDYPEAKLVAVDCRSRTCVIEYDVPAEKSKEIMVFMQLTMPHGPLSSPSSSEDVEGIVRLSFDAKLDDIRDPQDYRQWVNWSTEVVEKRRNEIRDYRRKGVKWWK